MITELDKKTALVLIDLQKGIVGMVAAEAIGKILANAAILVEAFHKAGLPIVIVNVKPGGAWTRARKDEKMAGGGFKDEWLEIVPEIKTADTDIFITKHTWSAFYETGLHEKLQQAGVTGIVLGGVSTSVGVEGTARTASEHGYNITFASDAMMDRSEEAHQHSLTRIFPRIGEVGTTDELLPYIK